ncbi:MAG: RNase H-like domain-containing protein, partial [Sphingobacterium sp.]
INACYLTMPKWDRPFVIFADASEVAVAAALAQTNDAEDSLEFISFASKKLNETQQNWSPTERELFAIVWSCEHFSNYIKGSRPLVYSDHASFEYLTTLQSPKIFRWAVRLSEFSPWVKHIAGENNNVADWLSRSMPAMDSELEPDYAFVPFVQHLVHEAADSFTLPTPQQMQADAKAEEVDLPPGTLDWYDGIAYGRRTKKLFIPSKYRMQLVMWFHASRYGGHQGVTRTANRLRKLVFWPNLQRDVQQFVGSCPICNVIKPLVRSNLAVDLSWAQVSVSCVASFSINTEMTSRPPLIPLISCCEARTRRRRSVG